MSKTGIRMRMQLFNVQSKNRQEVSLVYCTNQTKRLMENTKGSDED